MKGQIKIPEKDEKIDNLSNEEFKTLVIRMLSEMIKLSGKMKAIQRDIKETVQGTNSEGKETGTQINDLE